MSSMPRVGDKTENPETLAALRGLLRAADYTEAGVAAALHLEAQPGIHEADIPAHERRLPHGTPLAVLIQLFILGVRVSVDDASRALAPLPLERLYRVGLLRRYGGLVASPVRITPWSGLTLVHDPDSSHRLRPNHVTGIGPAARTLASLTLRRPVESALDLGAGSGIQALLAAQHSTQVTAVDINPRALRYTRLNALLNCLSNVECLQGSLFEPVKGSLFDLIVANPPYVISPDFQYSFRDSGQPGDTLCRTVVSEAPAFLHEGGVAHILCNWACHAKEQWWEPVENWVKGRGCDVLLLHYGGSDPLSYAAIWIQSSAHGEGKAFSQALDRWLEYYRVSGIEGIVYGTILLRRRAGGSNWMQRLDMNSGPVGSASDQISRLFEAQNYLASLGDERALLAERFRPANGQRMEQTILYRDGQYMVQNARLLLEDGIGIDAEVSPQLINLLLRLDGERRLSDLIEEVAEDTEVDPVRLANDALPAIRLLFEQGLLYRYPTQPQT